MFSQFLIITDLIGQPFITSHTYVTYVNHFTYVLSHIRHISHTCQNVVVLKIERYETGLTQGYNTDGSSR